VSNTVSSVFDSIGISRARKATGDLVSAFADLLPASPQKRIIFHSVVLSTIALVFSSLTPGGTFASVSMNYSTDYINTYSLPGDVLVTDEDGYLVKVNPQTNESIRVGLTDLAVHTVQSGETLSEISAKYGVSMNTIKWENNISNSNSLRIGQKLMVPPIDGIGYKVKSKDTLEKVAKKYEISTDAIIAQNGLESTKIVKGQEIFLPNAKPIVPKTSAYVAISGSTYRAPVSRYHPSASSAPTSNSAPVVGKIFIKPTRGIITQGYHPGHYAIDLADRSKPPIWAAGAGTVSKVNVGTWGGGYGNYVIVDHGNGLQTLYAHMDSVNVVKGQHVNQGDVIGIMGNTGRVYGVTGIHLHWEVRQNGVKQYPGNYY